MRCDLTLGKKRDQGEEQSGKTPEHRIVQATYRGIGGITEKPSPAPVRACGARWGWE